MNEKTLAVLKATSTNTQAIGRRIASVKNHKEDLEVLADALRLSAETLDHIVATIYK